MNLGQRTRSPLLSVTSDPSPRTIGGSSKHAAEAQWAPSGLMTSASCDVPTKGFDGRPSPGGWTMTNVFLLGWDGAGNPLAIDLTTGRVLVEDHTFGGVHTVADSFEAFLTSGLVE